MRALCLVGIRIGTLVLVMSPAIAVAQGTPVQQKICWDGTADGAATFDDDIFRCDDPAGQPTDGAGHSNIDVPLGKTLMIEYISMRCFASDGQTTPAALVLATVADRADGVDGTMFAVHRFPMDLLGTNRRGDPFHFVGQETRVYAKGQQWALPELRVVVAVQGPGYVTCAGTVSGQLMPSP